MHHVKCAHLVHAAWLTNPMGMCLGWFRVGCCSAHEHAHKQGPTSLLCSLNKCYFPMCLGRNNLYRLKGLCAGFCTYNRLYTLFTSALYQGPSDPLIFGWLGLSWPWVRHLRFVLHHIKYSSRGECTPYRDALLIGRCNDLDEIITYPSCKSCPDLVTNSICRSYCLQWVCFTTAVQTN